MRQAPKRLEEFINGVDLWNTLYEELDPKEMGLPPGAECILERYVYLHCAVQRLESEVDGNEIEVIKGVQRVNLRCNLIVKYNASLLQLAAELGLGVRSKARADRSQQIANGEKPSTGVGQTGKRQSDLLDFAAESVRIRKGTDG